MDLYLYVMNNEVFLDKKFMKYGFTTNPHKTLNEVKTQLPHPYYYERLWKITYMKEVKLYNVHPNDYIKAVMRSPTFAYDISSYCNSHEYFIGNPDDIMKLLLDNGYELKDVPLEDIEDISTNRNYWLSLKNLFV
jgi:hypothetical protein